MKQRFERSPYKHLLKDSNIKLWLENAERGSVITASEYLRRMGRICKEMRTTPSALAEMNEKAAGDFLINLVSQLEGDKLAGSSIAGYVKTVKSWFAFNDIIVKKKVKIEDANDHKKYENETVPTKEELDRILNAADLRAKTAIVLMAFSGCRVEVLGDFLGSDGLKVGDFLELALKDEKVEFSRIPAMIKVRRAISKTSNPYLSFLPEQGCEYLKQYLEYRMRSLKEKIKPESPIITATLKNQKKIGSHIRTANVGDAIRNAIRDAGFSWRPYVFRRYFDVRMMQAEADGIIIRDWRQYWMGHSGDIEAVYTVNKRLPEDVIEKMRDAYSKAAEKYLITTKKEATSQEMILSTFNRQFLSMAGYSEEEISKLGDLSKLSAQEIQDLIKEKSMQSLGLNGNNKQKVVSMSEVKNWILQGWEYVTMLPSNEAIIRLPNGS
jgi:site-specific recombinase XerD